MNSAVCECRLDTSKKNGCKISKFGNVVEEKLINRSWIKSQTYCDLRQIRRQQNHETDVDNLLLCIC